jgi:CRISPR-associated protein Cst1
MLSYSGHPFVDVGVATITAFAGKLNPQDLAEKDLDDIVNYIECEYVRNPLKSFLTVSFPNSGFTQPAYENQPEKRAIYANNVLHAYKADAPTLDVRCTFTGEPAADVTFDVKGELEPGRSYRQHIPLLTGEGVINFFPYGDAGLPVSGKAMLALQALPLGCAKCGGRLLAVHSDNDEITLHFARRFLMENRRAIVLAQQAGEKKLREAQYSHRTLLIDTLKEARAMQAEAVDDHRPFSLTAYHFSNSGQGPDLAIYHLPLEIIGFLREMAKAVYRPQWDAIVYRAWEIPPKKKAAQVEGEAFKPRRNWLYEDVFQLPGNAKTFMRTYFLRAALHNIKMFDTDPRQDYSLTAEADLVSWTITAQFLGRVLHMDHDRIESIRQLGDALAEYVSGQNDRRFFREFYTEQRYDFFRTALIRANISHVKRGNPPFIRLDPYIAVFEEGDDLARSDWRFARDLVLIRMVERLHERGWLARNEELLSEIEKGPEQESA